LNHGVLSKAVSPIDVTEIGMSMVLKLVQPLKAAKFIVVTELGIEMDNKLEQPLKA